ncbi:ADP-ribosylhydrolase ARH1-like [Mercenaria mercenaria]|uniref:ADP-ribosylhydrolase ARH1-like n=1 Tax=Mercenaria mercenaria TaxID=6596 RepID=UPI001E1D91B4|nr:ADP-ribosylhydrolase ARH1-like [Mercenaria mercenaria]
MNGSYDPTEPGIDTGNSLNEHEDLIFIKRLTEHGGVKSINIKPSGWRLIYCALLHRQTAHALTVFEYKTANNFAYWRLAKNYKSDIYDIDKRHPDESFFASRKLLKPDVDIDTECMVPFNDDGVSSAAAVRAICIGFRHPINWDVKNLIKLSIKRGRMTHQHSVGNLGSLVTALLTSYAIQKIQVRQ